MRFQVPCLPEAPDPECRRRGSGPQPAVKQALLSLLSPARPLISPVWVVCPSAPADRWRVRGWGGALSPRGAPTRVPSLGGGGKDAMPRPPLCALTFPARARLPGRLTERVPPKVA